MKEVIVMDVDKVVSMFGVGDETSSEDILGAASRAAELEDHPNPAALSVFVGIGGVTPAKPAAGGLFASVMSAEESARAKHQALVEEIDREHAGQVALLHAIVSDNWEAISSLSLVGDYGREVSFAFAQERTASGSGKAKAYVCVSHGICIDIGHQISPQHICATVYPRCIKTGRPSFTKVFISRDYPYQNEDVAEYSVVLNEVTAELVMKEVFALLAKRVMKAAEPLPE